MLARCLVCLLPVVLSAAALAPPSSPGSASSPEPVVVRGQVLTLADALKGPRACGQTGRDSVAKQVVVVEDDGTMVPLLSEDASRAFFLDERLRKCPSEIQGRRFAGVPYLQVVSFKIERDGRLQTPEYYCDVCAISVLYPQICPCCQGPVELRMRPASGN